MELVLVILLMITYFIFYKALHSSSQSQQETLMNNFYTFVIVSLFIGFTGALVTTLTFNVILLLFSMFGIVMSLTIKLKKSHSLPHNFSLILFSFTIIMAMSLVFKLVITIDESIYLNHNAKDNNTHTYTTSNTINEDLTPVQLYRVVDGDTVNVINDNGETLRVRMLLIDTPETVHPNRPVEPFGPEASARLEGLLTNANQIYLEYDSGDKQDRYGRELAYVYADNTNVHEVLLEEGLARVGYVYEQQKHLKSFREKEKIAKQQNTGIWSIANYVNEDGEGFNYEEENGDYSEDEFDMSKNESQSSELFQNCTELRKVYPEGVTSDHPAYQSKLDRDNDGHACE